MIAAHLFAGSDGALWDTRAPDCFSGRPLRACYQTHAGELDTLAKVKATLRAGPCAWSGGYQLYFVTRDGGALAFETVRKQWRNVVSDYLDGADSGWTLARCEVNYEDSDLTCSHSGAAIPAAYGEDETGDSDLE